MNAPLSAEAKQFAYACGIKDIGGLYDRLIAVERSLQAAHATLDSQVAIISRLVERIAALETAPHLRKVEKRG
jgi:hypothetical protein